MTYKDLLSEAFEEDSLRMDALQLCILNKERLELPPCDWCNVISSRYWDTMPFDDFTAVAKQYHRKGILATADL